MIGHLECFLPTGALGGQAEQVLIRNHDQRVDILLQFVDAAIGRFRAATAFEGEGLGHHTHRQDATLSRHARDDRRGPRAGTAAHAGGDEHHMRAFQMPGQFVGGLLGGGAADFGLGARAQTLRQMWAELDAAIGAAVHQLLCVGVGDHEFDALQIERNHVVDGVGAAPADPDHRNAGREIGVGRLWHGQVQGHRGAPEETGVKRVV